MIRLLLFLSVAGLLWLGWRRWHVSREAAKLTEIFEAVPNAIPYFPGEKHYGTLSDEQAQQLEDIAPSVSSSAGAHPCRVTLDDGTEYACVFIAPAQAYIDALWEWPEDLAGDDPDAAPVDIERVVRIEESPYRVPPSIAKQILAHDLGDRGGMRFTAAFTTGDRWRYRLNDYAEFLSAPAGLSFADVVEIAGFDDDARKLPKGRALAFRWCLHGHGVPPKNVQIYKR